MMTAVQTTGSPSRPQPHECMFPTWDRQALCYRYWPASRPSQKALLLLHRGHEHAGRWSEFVQDLGLEDFHVFAWDGRGHGRSPGARGAAPDFAAVVRDLDCFVRHVSGRHDIPLENLVVLGHSVSAVTAAAWVHDYAPPIRAMILATPAFRVKLYVPFAIPLLRLRQRLNPNATVQSYVRAAMLTHDPTQAQQYDADELISRRIAVNVLLDLHDTSTRLIADAGAITTPTLMLTAGADWVVNNRAAEYFFENLGSPAKQVQHFPGFGHAIFHERERTRVADAVRSFLRESFRRRIEPPPMCNTDRAGHTYDEYQRLLRPLPALCSKRWSFALQRLMMQTAGRLSEGIRLGWRTGFDSGPTLDYAYRNQASGTTPIGRWIDRAYLNAIGWRGIRQRKVHLEQVLDETIHRLRAAGEPVHLLDIAAGPGRYLLETLKRHEDLDITAELRDRNPEGLEQGRRLAAEMGLNNVVYQEGDAFCRESIAAATPRPSVAIVSGLYELFPDNAPVRDSLAGLAEAIRPDGYLIYTNQPWHPQVEMIARVLTNRDGRPWIMRRRTQAEMDALVRAAGFEKLDMRIDRDGIFTVSVARRM